MEHTTAPAQKEVNPTKTWVVLHNLAQIYSSSMKDTRWMNKKGKLLQGQEQHQCLYGVEEDSSQFIATKVHGVFVQHTIWLTEKHKPVPSRSILHLTPAIYTLKKVLSYNEKWWHDVLGNPSAAMKSLWQGMTGKRRKQSNTVHRANPCRKGWTDENAISGLFWKKTVKEVKGWPQQKEQKKTKPKTLENSICCNFCNFILVGTFFL